MMTDTLEKPKVVNTIRRFDLPDIDRHGPWMLKRLAAAYPHLNEGQVLGWLRSVLYLNEFLFLFQENSVALAHAYRPDVLAPRLIVQEKFVWAKSSDWIWEAALFYDRFVAWAKSQEAEQIVVLEQTDVPEGVVKEKLGRLLERKVVYMRL